MQEPTSKKKLVDVCLAEAQPPHFEPKALWSELHKIDKDVQY